MNERKIKMDELIKQNKGKFTNYNSVSEKSVNIHRLLLITNDQDLQLIVQLIRKVLV